VRIWIDCTAAAHSLVVQPVIARPEGQGHEVIVTAREHGRRWGFSICPQFSPTAV
jgi:predicted glycosyltransferase